MNLFAAQVSVLVLVWLALVALGTVVAVALVRGLESPEERTTRLQERRNEAFGRCVAGAVRYRNQEKP